MSDETTEKSKVEEPKVEEKKEEPKKKEVVPLSDKEVLLKNMEACIAEYGGISNIPYNHAYWTWVNTYRSL